MKISPKRILYLDEVRSLAIILVVLGHIVRYYSNDFTSWMICSGIFSLTRIGVPLFFMVSGALLLTRKHVIMEFLKKRFKRVVLPFAFWIIVYIILGVVIWQYALTPQYCFEIILGSNGLSSPLWFIWSLLGIYLLIPIISSFIREYDIFAYEYCIVITLVLSLLFTIGFFQIQQAKFDFRVIYNFFSVLGYFILGSCIHNTVFYTSKRNSFLIGLVLFIIGIVGHFILIYNAGLGGFALKPVDYFNIFVVLETVGLFIAFKYANVKMISSKLKPLKERKLGEIIVLFSSCSFGIYFSNYILTLYLFKFGFMKPWRAYGLTYFPASCIIVIGVCWLLIWIMSKVPILKIGSGVK